MSFSRTVRPWLPVVFIVVLAILIVLTTINYNTRRSSKRHSPKHSKEIPSKKEHKDTNSTKKTKKTKKDSKDKLLVANNNWRNLLPWDIEHKRFLPNYFTYHSILNASEKVAYHKGNIVYVHVPKSGGTTMAKCFTAMIKRSKGYSKFYGPIGEKGLDTVLKEVNERNDSKVSIFSGEYAFKMCERLDGKPCSYFLMLREPYDRMVSSYMFCKRHSDDKSNFFCPLNSNKLTIIEWALLQRSFFFRQLIIHDDLCKGKYDDRFDFNNLIDIKQDVVKDDFPCWMKLEAVLNSTLSQEERDGLLKYLSDSLEQWFAGVGILELMTETLHTLDTIYGLNASSLCTNIHANRSPSLKNKKGVTSTKEKYMKQLKSDPRVREALRPDITLYKRVKGIIKEQIIVRQQILNT